MTSKDQIDLFKRPEGLHWPEVRAWLQDNPQTIADDRSLLEEIGLKPHGRNVVEFGRAALTKLEEAAEHEADARKRIESIARANFAAQAQTHGAVVDLLDSRNHADLARRVDELAQLRFGLLAGVVALEGPERTPAGWRAMAEGQIDLVIGHQQVSRMGFQPTALGLFGDRAPEIRSMAMVRMALWEPARTGLLAFGSADEAGFTADMGAELVAFLARVVERTAERWPVL